MIGNALSGLFLSTPIAAENPVSSSNSSSRIERSFDDTFSGIFREKMREASSKPTRRAGPVGLNKPLESASKSSASQDEIKVDRKRPESAQAVAAYNEIDCNIYVREDRSDRTVVEAEDVKDGHSAAEEASGMISLVAALLEGLFGKLGEKAFGSGDQTDQTPGLAIADGDGQIEEIRGLLEGKIEHLMDLIEKIGPDETTAKMSVLIDDLRGLLDKVKELMNSNSAGEKSGIVFEAEGVVDYASLVAKLHAQARGTMDKLGVRISEASGQDESVYGETAPKAEIHQSDAAQSLVTEEKEEPKSKVSESKTGLENKVDNKQVQTLKPDEKPGSNRGWALQENANTDIIAQKSETPAAKPEIAEFRLSGKPLGQSVTNQVTMRLKLMAGENRQEMEVQLKPESLGKLTLRIIHERGEILAKITAENDQVKSILESNMQLLKDSLEKSGLTVQSLSVSVGSGDGGGRTQDNESKKEGSREARIPKADGGSGKKAGALFGRDMPDENHSIDLSA